MSGWFPPLTPTQGFYSTPGAGLLWLLTSPGMDGAAEGLEHFLPIVLHYMGWCLLAPVFVGPLEVLSIAGGLSQVVYP